MKWFKLDGLMAHAQGPFKILINQIHVSTFYYRRTHKTPFLRNNSAISNVTQLIREGTAKY